MEELAGILYLIVGAVSSVWLESLMVEQGYKNEWGLAFTFGERIKSIILWPIFTLPSLVQFTVVFVQALFEDDQQ